MEVLNNPVVTVVLITIIGLVTVYAGVRLAVPIFTKKQGYPGEEAIEAALWPFVYSAIATAYKLSEDAMNDLDTRLEGLDRKALADAVYALLPDTLVVGGVAVPVWAVKRVVPQERWEAMVQDGFDYLMLLYRQNELTLDGWMREQIGELEGAQPVEAS